MDPCQALGIKLQRGDPGYKTESEKKEEAEKKPE
jgi:hypothetical protein